MDAGPYCFLSSDPTHKLRFSQTNRKLTNHILALHLQKLVNQFFREQDFLIIFNHISTNSGGYHKTASTQPRDSESPLELEGGETTNIYSHTMGSTAFNEGHI